MQSRAYPRCPRQTTEADLKVWIRACHTQARGDVEHSKRTCHDALFLKKQFKSKCSISEYSNVHVDKFDSFFSTTTIFPYLAKLHTMYILGMYAITLDTMAKLGSMLSTVVLALGHVACQRSFGFVSKL